MGRVYENAVLVIAATSASDSTKGLFNVAAPPNFTPIRYKGKLSDSQVYAYVHRPGVGQRPLNRRGWAMQEHILARRLAQFTEMGVVWRCRAQVEANQARERESSTWETLVEEYSRRKSYGVFLDDNENLALRLFWSATKTTMANADRSGSDPVRGGPVRDVLGVPSWSWASMTGEVVYHRRGQRDAQSKDDNRLSYICGPIKPNGQGALVFETCSLKEVGFLAGIPSVSCLPRDYEDLRLINTESESEVASLQHPAVRDKHWCKHLNHDKAKYLVMDKPGTPDQMAVGWVVFDDGKAVTESVFCLPLAKELTRPWWMPPVETSEPFHAWCLFVRRRMESVPGKPSFGAAGDDVFERVGWGRILVPSWVEKEPRRRVYLV